MGYSRCPAPGNAGYVLVQLGKETAFGAGRGRDYGLSRMRILFDAALAVQNGRTISPAKRKRTF